LISYVTSKPSARQWSSFSLHQDPLRGNGHWFLLSHQGPLRGNGHRSLYIKTLCEVMVFDFLCHVETLYEAMIIDLFTSRPSTRQGSLISLSNWDPLCGNGHRIFRYRPSPQDWSNLFFKKSKLQKDFFRIETLYMVMIVESFGYRPSPRNWSNLFFKTSKYKKKYVFRIRALYMVMVAEFFGSRPSPRDWSNLVFSKKK